MRRFRVLPYKQGSKSAKALATGLNGKVLKLQGSTFTPTLEDVIINWGNGTLSIEGAGKFLNHPSLCKLASNKRYFFEKMKDSGNEDIVPRFWTNPVDIPDDAFPIVCRTILSGHSGNGIVIANTRDDLVACQLYVQYVKKKDEYRVHVGKSSGAGFEFDTRVIAIQRKAKRTGAETVNWQVRNLANGFVYVRNDVNPPSCVELAAKRAFEATGLDFGAVDVIYNANQNKAYVLEINTAPGLEGQTVTDYAEFFKEVA